MLRNEAPASSINDNLHSIMTRAQCSEELQNVQESDTTEDDSSNNDGYIITILIEESTRENNSVTSQLSNKTKAQSFKHVFRVFFVPFRCPL
jgi:hypothetical protein